MTDSDFGGPAFPKPDERPVCKLCGLEDGACICRSIPKQPQPDEVEAIAQEIWHRFAAVDHVEWEEETHKAEYLMCAAAILAMQAERQGDNTIQRDKIYRAAERSNTRFGQWIPERWVNIFVEEMSK